MKCEICGKEILRDSQCINYKYYHNDCIENLQQENKQLKERIEYLERSNNRREDTILEQRQEISNLEDTYCDRTDCSSRIKDSKKYDSLKQKCEKQVDNWNKLKEWVNKHYDYYMNNEDYIGGRLCFTDMKSKMHELEGSDSNVKD